MLNYSSVKKNINVCKNKKKYVKDRIDRDKK